MYKKVALSLGMLYAIVSAYLLIMRIDFSGADSARGVGFSAACGLASYVAGAYLFLPPRKLNKLFGGTLLLVSLALLVLQIWFRSYYPHIAQ